MNWIVKQLMLKLFIFPFTNLFLKQSYFNLQMVILIIRCFNARLSNRPAQWYYTWKLKKVNPLKLYYPISKHIETQWKMYVIVAWNFVNWKKTNTKLSEFLWIVTGLKRNLKWFVLLNFLWIFTCICCFSVISMDWYFKLQKLCKLWK